MTITVLFHGLLISHSPCSDHADCPAFSSVVSFYCPEKSFIYFIVISIMDLKALRLLCDAHGMDLSGNISAVIVGGHDIHLILFGERHKRVVCQLPAREHFRFALLIQKGLYTIRGSSKITAKNNSLMLKLCKKRRKIVRRMDSVKRYERIVKGNDFTCIQASAQFYPFPEQESVERRKT